MRRPVTVLAIALAMVSLVALGYSVAELSDGLTEVPEHWWSMAPVVGLAAAGALALIGRRERAH